MVKKMEAWQTYDGQIFPNERMAVSHERFKQGITDGLMQAIVQLERWAEEGCGGNLTKEEIQETSYWKNAQMLRAHFEREGKL